MGPSISVVGLGYIGLPLSLCFCEKGFRVVGVDVNEALIGQLQQGFTEVHENYDGEPLETVLQRNLVSGSFVPTSKIEEASTQVDTYIITVGLPVSPAGELNYGIIKNATEQLGRVVKHGDLLLFRSTVVPGMLEELIVPILESTSGLTAGSDFYFAYAAERVAEGRAMLEFQTLDIVLAGLTEKCADKAAELLTRLTNGTIHKTNLRIAQAVKVIENAQRDVNIALAQEISKFAEYHGVNVYELIRMANTHPRVNLLEPGIGVGGFCIPNAFHYLMGSLHPSQSLPLFELARKTNVTAPDRIVDKLEQKLIEVGKQLDGSIIAVLGLGMKDFSNDIRLSPATELIRRLQSRGASVKAFDPTVSLQLPYQVPSLEECLMGTDALVVATWQREFESLDIMGAVNKSNIQGCIVDIKHRLSQVGSRRLTTVGI